MRSSYIADNSLFQVTGIVLSFLISFIGIRMLAYWRSFVFHSGRYRYRDKVTTRQLKQMPVPFVKVQWTTKGSIGSTEVILRGIRQLEELASEDPVFYRRFLSAEVVTQSGEQAGLIEHAFADGPLPRPSCIVTPPSYQTEKGTQLKARQLHYMVELRRTGRNRKPGKTFIIHFDEDTVMVPAEFRKMLAKLAYTDKSILSGPIYYPLEYDDASLLARASEASRPITCFECRTVMETGVPLHVHGSNLAIEEDLENRVGWDIGLLHGAPFVAEDYTFGMDAFMREGREVFGWHGCVALEQPPFSFPSVFRQRYRWIFGVLQGMSVDAKQPDFVRLPWRLRKKVIWGTRYRISTFVLGTIVGSLSLVYIPFWLTVVIASTADGRPIRTPWELTAWFALIGIMWLGANIVGAFVNVMHAGFSPTRRILEISRAVCMSPVASMTENLSGLQAVLQWLGGHRQVGWETTPSTKAADDVINGKADRLALPLAETVTEAPVPWLGEPARARIMSALATTAAAALVVFLYIGTPLVITVQNLTGSTAWLAPGMLIAAGIIALLIGIGATIWRTSRPARVSAQTKAPEAMLPEGADRMAPAAAVFPGGSP
jgi:hypothetical protein